MGFKPRRRQPTFGEEVAIDVADRLVRIPERNSAYAVCAAANRRIIQLVEQELGDIPLHEIKDQGLALNQTYWEEWQHLKAQGPAASDLANALRKTPLSDWHMRLTQKEADALREWIWKVSDDV